jgi:protein-L-isoaspartate(D-aspartate) O-methyltransferase
MLLESRQRALLLVIAAILTLGGCRGAPASYETQRAEMVQHQLIQRGVADERILAAFRSVPREEFVLPSVREHAYDDIEAPIGHGQSIDRAYENALMLQALALTPSDRVLEVGTGSGYLASLMSQLAAQVATIEIDPALAQEAQVRLARLGYGRVAVRVGDGFLGWPERAPFDAIVLTCSPPVIPQPLIEQLAEGGRLVLPFGGEKRFQELVLYRKIRGQLSESRRLAPTEFVPMEGTIRGR